MRTKTLFGFITLLILTACGGGGGGSPVVDSSSNPTKNTVKPGVANANNTAPWKNETLETPNGSQVSSAKNNINEINAALLVSISSSGKKNKTDTIQQTIKGSVRGSINYKNTYTIDDDIVGDAYSYSNNSVVKYLGYEEISFGINGQSKFDVTFNQTSLNNFTYNLKGESTISYKDASGVFAFFMAYEDNSTMIDGVETITSTYTIDNETYNSTTVYSLNGDYTYTATYTENGITYTSTSTAIGDTTTDVISHQENGKTIIDEESTSRYTLNEIDGVRHEVYSYTYTENGITYTSNSTTIGDTTTYTLSHLEDGVLVIDSESTGTYTSMLVDGVLTEIYSEEYYENGILYTSSTTTSNGITYYVISHIENGQTFIDSNSSYTVTTTNGIETEYYAETYYENGIVYYYVSTTTNGVTEDITSHVENGQTIIDVQGRYTEEIVNGKTVETYVETYWYQGILFESTSTTVDGVTTVVTNWVENGKAFSETYTY